MHTNAGFKGFINVTKREEIRFLIVINFKKNKVKRISLVIMQSGKVGILFIKRLTMITVNATYNKHLIFLYQLLAND